MQILKLLRRRRWRRKRGGLDLLTFKTFQLFSQVLFIPVFLVFQVFLRGRKRGEQKEGEPEKKNRFYMT